MGQGRKLGRTVVLEEVSPHPVCWGGPEHTFVSRRVSHSEARVQGTFAHSQLSLATSQASLGGEAALISKGNTPEKGAASSF